MCEILRLKRDHFMFGYKMGFLRKSEVKSDIYAPVFFLILHVEKTAWPLQQYSPPQRELVVMCDKEPIANKLNI